MSKEAVEAYFGWLATNKSYYDKTVALGAPFGTIGFGLDPHDLKALTIAAQRGHQILLTGTPDEDPFQVLDDAEATMARVMQFYVDDRYGED